jgi:predicted DNA-binding transcriptional regulator AlpA
MRPDVLQGDFQAASGGIEQARGGAHFGLQLLNTPRVCARLGVSRWTWRRWVKTGVAPAPLSGLPGHPKWRQRDIEAFADGAYRRATGRRSYFGHARQLRDEQGVTR